MITNFENISQRRYLRNLEEVRPKFLAPKIYNESGMFFRNNAINIINGWQDLECGNSNKKYELALDAFIELSYNEDSSDVRTAYEYLFESANMVRDASALANSIKHRTARFKSRIATRIKRKMQASDNAVQNIVSSINAKLPDGKHIQNAGVAKTSASNNSDEETKTESYLNKLLYRANYLVECDRILDNYSIIKEAIGDICIYEDDAYSTAYNIAEASDHIVSNFINKFNACLEYAYILLNEKGISFNKQDVVLGVTDYFIFNNHISEAYKNNIRIIIKYSPIYEQKDFAKIDFLLNDKEPMINESKEEEFDFDSFIEVNMAFVENELSKAVKDKVKNLKSQAKQAKNDFKNAKKGNPEERKNNDIEKMINDYRDEVAKDTMKDNSSKFKTLLNRIFTKNPDQIVNEIPGTFTVLRTSIVIGATAINPMLGVVTAFTNYILRLHLSRPQYEKIINAYKKEITSVVKKKESTKDEKQKEKYERYIEALKKDLEKIREKDRGIYSDEENDDRDAYGYNDNFGDHDNSGNDSDDDFDFDFDDDDWDTDFEEASLVNKLSSKYGNILAIGYGGNIASKILESLVDVDDIDGLIVNNIIKLPDEDLVDTVKFVVHSSAIQEKYKLKNKLKEQLEEYRNIGYNESTYDRISALNESIRCIDEQSHYNDSIESMLYSLRVIEKITSLNENVINDKEYLNEMNFSNTIKLALNNMKKNITKLSDTEKKVSSEIDASANILSKSIEDAVKTNNREAVIKGKIIPRFSKMIKLALATGGVWIINPTIAVIGAIGYLAASKKMQDKERQLILDDIEIEIKMCERYISDAENKNDLKKVREYEKILRNLQRQQQRIKYKMNVISNKSIPNSTAKPGDDDD